MVNLIDFFRGKEKSKNIIYDPCCNNCINGDREYMDSDSMVSRGIKCSLEIENKNKFDYLCDSYEKDKEFIAYNKSL